MSDAWVPVKLRVRHLAVGDVVIGKAGDLWMVTELVNHATGPSRYVTVARGGEEHTADMDLDSALQTLVPVAERDAMRICRDELGAKLEART